MIPQTHHSSQIITKNIPTKSIRFRKWHTHSLKLNVSQCNKPTTDNNAEMILFWPLEFVAHGRLSSSVYALLDERQWTSTSTRSDAPHSPLLKCRNGDPRLDVERCALGRSSYRKPRWVKNWRVFFYYYYYYLFFNASSFLDSVSESQVGGVAAWPFQFQHCTPARGRDENNAQYIITRYKIPKQKRGAAHTRISIVDSSVNS